MVILESSVKGFEDDHLSHEGGMRELEHFSLEKRRLREGSYQCLKLPEGKMQR